MMRKTQQLINVLGVNEWFMKIEKQTLGLDFPSPAADMNKWLLYVIATSGYSNG